METFPEILPVPSFKLKVYSVTHTLFGQFTSLPLLYLFLFISLLHIKPHIQHLLYIVLFELVISVCALARFPIYILLTRLKFNKSVLGRKISEYSLAVFKDLPLLRQILGFGFFMGFLDNNVKRQNYLLL